MRRYRALQRDGYTAVGLTVPPSDEVRVEMLIEWGRGKFTREQAEAFVASTPHTSLISDDDEEWDD